MTLADFSPLPQGTDQFPVEYIENQGLIKLSEDGSAVVVGKTKPVDGLTLEHLEFFLGKPVRFEDIPAQELSEYLSRHFSADNTPGPEAPEADERLLLDKLAQDAPIVNLVNSVLMEGIRRQCSDIHLENHQGEARVRYRIDGILQTGRTLHRDSFPGVSSRLKIMANLNIIEKRLPQDGRMSVRLLGQAVEFRISVVPLADGESIVLRLFQKKGEITLLDNLGFPAPYLESLRTSIRNPNGLILLTGPTGSGKTTTLNAIVRELSKDQVKVLTIEDPVENFITGVNQIQTNETVGMTFDTVLRRVLRQDPDILMVGEIRDQLTAELCLRSALTGHLVLSTLHTNDALSAIPRLIDMGTEPYLLSAVLRSCSAQRLVRILCPRCRKETRVSPAQAARLGALGTWAETHFEAVGCQECHHTGYAGRTVAGEIFAMDEAAAEMILGEKRRQDFVGHFRKMGCRFLADDLGVRVRAGQTSLEELERVVGTV